MEDENHHLWIKKNISTYLGIATARYWEEKVRQRQQGISVMVASSTARTSLMVAAMAVGTPIEIFKL